MLAELKENLKAEIKVFKAAHALELKKRPAILSADGPGLQKLTSESEKLFVELNRLEEARLGSIAALFAEEPVQKNQKAMTLKEVVASPGIQESPMRVEFEKLSADYRSTALALHEETRENQRLLEFTGFALKRLITDLKDIASEPAYFPSGGQQARQAVRSTQSLLLNANA